MKSALYMLSFLFLFGAAALSTAHAQSFVVTTPYWCGSFWSSYPCDAAPYAQAPQYQYQYQPYQRAYIQPSYSVPYWQYPYQAPAAPACPYQYANGICQPAPQLAPAIYALYPNSGSVGDTITVYGSGFSIRDNSIKFGTGIIGGLVSSDGTYLTFTVPQQLAGYNVQQTVPGTYNVSVVNSDGRASNSAKFTVNQVAYWRAPSISSISGPTQIAAGSQGTWTIWVQNPGSQYLTTGVRWGDEYQYGYAAAPQQNYSLGTQLSFMHSYMQRGTYTATFTAQNASGQQTTSSVTVYVY